MSEMCEYWEGFLEIVLILKALIAADREGDWHAHLQATQNLLPVFRECDCIKGELRSEKKFSSNERA